MNVQISSSDEWLTRNVAPGTVIHAIIAFHWDDAKQTLIIGDRKERFPECSRSATFKLLL